MEDLAKGLRAAGLPRETPALGQAAE
jgi:hypothetical protein